MAWVRAGKVLAERVARRAEGSTFVSAIEKVYTGTVWDRALTSMSAFQLHNRDRPAFVEWRGPTSFQISRADRSQFSPVQN